MAWNSSSLTCRLTCPALINKSWIVTCGWKAADFCRLQESPVFACFVFWFVLMLPWTLFSTTYELHVELASIGDVFVSAFKALGSGTMMTLNICYFRASLAMRKPFTYQDLFWAPLVFNSASVWLVLFLRLRVGRHRMHSFFGPWHRIVVAWLVAWLVLRSLTSHE